MKTTATVKLVLLFVCLASTARGDTFGSGSSTFGIEFVNIGDHGNTADTTGSPNPAGAVAQAYRIGKFEISRDMINKVNAEGGLGITLQDMTPDGGNGADKPATGVSWFEATKFVNWLNTSTGSTPAYKFDDSGSFQLWAPEDAGYNPANLYRNSLATYFLPSADEWYKAAYYDPTRGVYFDYPTGSDAAPTLVASGTAAGTAVYNQLFSSTGPADITLAGGLSPYGTMAQGGNVWEWDETDFHLVNNSVFQNRGRRGGGWESPSDRLSSSVRDFTGPFFEIRNTGFRVASIAIPEPGTLLLGSLACVGLLLRRRRVRR